MEINTVQMAANLPSPPLSPRPSPPSGEPLPKEDDESSPRPWTPPPPDIRIRPPYRSFPASMLTEKDIPSNEEGEFSTHLVSYSKNIWRVDVS